MLDPITKRYEDRSTLKQFEFIFFCDCCGRAVPTTVMEFHSHFRRKVFLTNEEREARSIIYADHHRKAYERANNEILHELNRCEICGSMICENCSVYNEKDDGKVICRKCSAASEENRGGQE